jgi:hypothetical protein
MREEIEGEGIGDDDGDVSFLLSINIINNTSYKRDV